MDVGFRCVFDYGALDQRILAQGILASKTREAFSPLVPLLGGEFVWMLVFGAFLIMGFWRKVFGDGFCLFGFTLFAKRFLRLSPCLVERPLGAR